MKHPIYLTLPILGWLIAAVLIGIYAAPFAHESTLNAVSINPFIYIGIILALIVGGAVAWVLMMNHARPKYVDLAFAIGIGLVLTNAAVQFLPEIFDGTLFTQFAARWIMVFSITFIFLSIIKAMQESWENVLKLSPASNIIIIIVTSVSATLIGTGFSPLIAILLLIGAAIYDAIAVWKTKSMIFMATYLTERRILPGIAVPYPENEGKFALLGGGDIFFIVLVATSFHAVSTLFMYVTAATMVGAVVLLFFTSKKDTYYPALPFILAGAIVGIGIATTVGAIT